MHGQKEGKGKQKKEEEEGVEEEEEEGGEGGGEEKEKYSMEASPQKRPKTSAKHNTPS